MFGSESLLIKGRPMHRPRIVGCFTGTPKPLLEGKPLSAIAKTARAFPISLTRTGLIGDVQADTSVHGGPDKALHAYPAAHYAVWRAELGREDLVAGRFGENLTVEGLDEATTCIGDVFEIGDARVQISQGRQPCWKLAAHTGEPRMAALFTKTARTGWYFRVLEGGAIGAGDTLTLVVRPHPDLSVAEVTTARRRRRIDRETARRYAEVKALASGWREAFAQMAQSVPEDTSARLATPE